MAITKVTTAMKTPPTSAEVTAHVTAFDDVPVRRDIATLALHTAISDNKAAYNLSNAFIDQFEDSTGIATTSTVARHSNEYAMAGTATTETLGYGDGISISYAVSGTAQNLNGALLEDNATNAYGALFVSPSTGSPGYLDMDLTVPHKLTQAEFFNMTTAARVNDVSLYRSSDNSNWTLVAATGVTGGGSTNASHVLSGINTDAWYGITFSALEYRYWRWKVDAYYNNGNANAGISEIKMQNAERTVVAASGNYTSTTQTALSSVSTMGIVVLYKNNAGTATLNTDLVAQVSANGGTNYSSATLVAGGTFSSGINIAAVSGVSVTAGTTPKYKISFANQSSASKETQVHGVALLY